MYSLVEKVPSGKEPSEKLQPGVGTKSCNDFEHCDPASDEHAPRHCCCVAAPDEHDHRPAHLQQGHPPTAGSGRSSRRWERSNRKKEQPDDINATPQKCDTDGQRPPQWYGNQQRQFGVNIPWQEQTSDNNGSSEQQREVNGSNNNNDADFAGSSHLSEPGKGGFWGPDPTDRI